MGSQLNKESPNVQRWKTLLQVGRKAFFFRLGLNSDLEPYTFQIVNTARAQKRELQIDEMIISLVDNDRRLQFFEETKAMATKLSYKKTSEKKNL